jgi:hypothetical protein
LALTIAVDVTHDASDGHAVVCLGAKRCEVRRAVDPAQSRIAFVIVADVERNTENRLATGSVAQVRQRLT